MQFTHFTRNFRNNTWLFFSNHCTGTRTGTDIRTAQKSLYSTGTAHAPKAIVRLFTTCNDCVRYQLMSE